MSSGKTYSLSGLRAEPCTYRKLSSRWERGQRDRRTPHPSRSGERPHFVETKISPQCTEVPEIVSRDSRPGGPPTFPRPRPTSPNPHCRHKVHFCQSLVRLFVWCGLTG